MGVRHLPVLFASALLACGGGSPRASLTAPTPGQGVLDLAPGSYTLSLTMSSMGEPVCNGGLCTSIGLCIGAGGPSSGTTATTSARVERAGEEVTIRADEASATFRVVLRFVGDTLAGYASGGFRDGSRYVSVAGGGGGAATATGTPRATAVAGKLDGQILIDGSGCSNNGHSWTLTPR